MIRLMVLATSAFAQQEPAKPQADNQCQTKCNVQASACMKPCSDEKDGEKMLACLKRCETANTQCKSTCTK